MPESGKYSVKNKDLSEYTSLPKSDHSHKIALTTMMPVVRGGSERSIFLMDNSSCDLNIGGA